MLQGKAFDIYNHPNNGFIDDFMGAGNVLPARIEDEFHVSKRNDRTLSALHEYDRLINYSSEAEAASNEEQAMRQIKKMQDDKIHHPIRLCRSLA